MIDVMNQEAAVRQAEQVLIDAQFADIMQGFNTQTPQLHDAVIDASLYMAGLQTNEKLLGNIHHANTVGAVALMSAQNEWAAREDNLRAMRALISEVDTDSED